MSKVLSILLATVMLLIGAVSGYSFVMYTSGTAAQEAPAENAEWADEETPAEDEGGWIDEMFNGTYWESGDLLLETVWEDGYYQVTVTGGDTALSYRCAYEDNIVIDDTGYCRLTGIGADDGQAPAQADHGVSAFLYSYETQTLTWQQADGQETVFTRIIDPLDESEWFSDGLTRRIRWLGGLDYEVYIEKMFYSWNYQCVLNEETDVLEGTGLKTHYGSEEYTDSHAAFALQDARRQLTWTDEKEPDAANGIVFEAVCMDLTRSIWDNEPYTAFISWMDGYYDVHVMDTETDHGYLCTYDWNTSTLTAVDPATVDVDSMSLYVDLTYYTSLATFVLEDDATLVWHDDSGLTGDGIALKGM